MQIDLRLIRHAHAIAQHGSFNRAADALGIAQPTLSRSIKQLEQHFGLALFARSSRGVEPTDVGLMFLREAAAVVAQVSDLERQVAMAKGLETGDVSMGVGPYPAEILAPECLRRFTSLHPGIRLRIQMDPPEVVARALRARSIDLAVADASAFDEDDAFEVVTRLPSMRAFVLVRRHHPLARMAVVTLADVLDYPLVQITRLPPRALKPLLRQRRQPVATNTAKPFPAVECPTVTLAMNAIRDSDAAVITPVVTVAEPLRSGAVRIAYHEPWMCSQWVIAKLRGRSLTPAAYAMIDEVIRANERAVAANEALGRRWDRRAALQAAPRSAARAGSAAPVPLGAHPTTGRAAPPRIRRR